jgi:hypothetical protein
MGENDGGPLNFVNDLGHCEGLAGSGYSEQHLVFLAMMQARNQLFDRRRLIAAG